MDCLDDGLTILYLLLSKITTEDDQKPWNKSKKRQINFSKGTCHTYSTLHHLFHFFKIPSICCALHHQTYMNMVNNLLDSRLWWKWWNKFFSLETEDNCDLYSLRQIVYMDRVFLLLVTFHFLMSRWYIKIFRYLQG